jgi:hypothetical protein
MRSHKSEGAASVTTAGRLVVAVPMGLSGPPGRLDAMGQGAAGAVSVLGRATSVGVLTAVFCATLAQPLSTSSMMPSSAVLAPRSGVAVDGFAFKRVP